jgi:amidase
MHRRGHRGPSGYSASATRETRFVTFERRHIDFRLQPRESQNPQGTGTKSESRVAETVYGHAGDQSPSCTSPLMCQLGLLHHHQMPNATTDLVYSAASDLAALIRTRAVSPVELLDASERQFTRLNPVVNAVVTPVYDDARMRARLAEAAVMRGDEIGLLHGLPIALKDLTETAGIRTTYGSRLFEHNVPKEDALLVSRLKAAGAIVVAKTNAPEFATGMNTRNAIFGTTLSPWNTANSSGGSSGGSAVAIATGMCALAEGSDHGGSIRVPSAMNNVVGLRVSPGRIPAYPNPWVLDTLNVHGPIARSVGDIALMLSVMAGPDARVPISISEPGSSFDSPSGEIKGWRVAWAPTLGGLFRNDAEVEEITSRAATGFSQLGCDVDTASPDLQGVTDVITVTRALRTATVYQQQLVQADRLENALLKDFVRRARELSLSDVARAESMRSAIWVRTQSFFENYDLLLLPTSQVASFPSGRAFPASIGGQPVQDTIQAVLSTYAISILGLPAISVPCGLTPNGDPVGLQIVGRWRGEANVLRAARVFEQAFPWSMRYPPPVDRDRHVGRKVGD